MRRTDIQYNLKIKFLIEQMTGCHETETKCLIFENEYNNENLENWIVRGI